MTQNVAIELPPEPESARRAREQLNAFRDVLDELSFVDLCLVVGELVAEASRTEHAVADPIRVRAELEHDRLRVTVAEGGSAYLLPSRRPEPGEPGFGLSLVQRLTDRWGMRREGDQATVWLEMLRDRRRPV